MSTLTITWNRVATGIFATLMIGMSVHAGPPGPTLDLTLAHVASFDSGFNPISQDNLFTCPVGHIQQFDVVMALSGTGPTEDFWTVSFSFELGPGLTAAAPWTPAAGTFDDDNNPGTAEQDHWQFGNDDFGEFPDDLKIIIVEADENEAANRQYGETPRPAAGAPDQLGFPTRLGSVFVQWDGSPTTVTVKSALAGSAGLPWGTYIGGELTPMPNSTLLGDQVSIGINLDVTDGVTMPNFSLFAQQWMNTDCGTCSGADLTGDNNVFADDLMLLASAWLCGT